MINIKLSGMNIWYHTTYFNEEVVDIQYEHRYVISSIRHIFGALNGRDCSLQRQARKVHCIHVMSLLEMVEGMNWLAIFLSALGNLACHHIAPVVFRVLWRNHIVQYNRLPSRKKADFDMRLGEIVLGCICVFVVVKAVLYEKELGSLGLVGSTYLGNVALGITIILDNSLPILCISSSCAVVS